MFQKTQVTAICQKIYLITNEDDISSKIWCPQTPLLTSIRYRISLIFYSVYPIPATQNTSSVFKYNNFTGYRKLIYKLYIH